MYKVKDEYSSLICSSQSVETNVPQIMVHHATEWYAASKKKKKETKKTTVRQILMYSQYYTILVTQSKEYMGLYRYRGQF